MVNKEKSAIFFSTNCLDEMKTCGRNRLEIQKEALAERYLGFPTEIDRSTHEAFEYLPAKVRGAIGGWSGA